jgi:hypothetical protein
VPLPRFHRKSQVHSRKATRVRGSAHGADQRDLGLTERGWRKIINIGPNSKTTVERIREVAAQHRRSAAVRCTPV